MQGKDVDPVGGMLVLVSGLLLLGAAGEFVFSKTGIPDPVWIVGAGILLGPVFDVVSVDLLRPAVPYFGAIALTVILTGGAYRLQLRDVVSAAPRGLLLGVLGFAFSMLGIVLFFWVGIRSGWLQPSPVMYWLLVGGIVGGTSALVVMPTVSHDKVDPQVARTLEVESSATDALAVVIAMALIDLLAMGSTDVTQPLVTLARQIGIGVGAGVIWSILLVPFYPALREQTHSYTLLLASMFLLYALTITAEGNGAMAVLVAALLLGNATIIVPRLIPGAQPQAFVPSAGGVTMQNQMTFLIKSFFFLLIGLMFPNDVRSIALGVVAGVVVLLFRIPAVAISVRGSGFTRKQKALLIVALPRGLAAGVLSTLPMQYHIIGADTLSGAVFAMIVTTILLFAFGMALASRLPD
jgi:Na+:H+ antiporter